MQRMCVPLPLDGPKTCLVWFTGTSGVSHGDHTRCRVSTRPQLWAQSCSSPGGKCREMTSVIDRFLSAPDQYESWSGYT